MRGASRIRAILAIAVGAGLTLVTLLLLRRIPAEEIQPTDVRPPGRWTFQADRLANVADGDELARVLSLPYVAGSRPAGGGDGVLRHDPEKTFAGVNLYTSGHGPEALLVDMTGEVLHRWQYPFDRAFPDMAPTSETAFFRRAYLYANGDLLVIFQGGGMLKLDRDSTLLWASGLPYFNHLTVDEHGTIWSIVKTATTRPELRPEAILEDSIVALDADGTMVGRWSLLDCFATSSFADLIHPLPDHADIFHTNTVVPIGSRETAATIFRPGDLLVSLREVDIVAVVDPGAATVRAAWRGPWRAQHQPIPDPAGNIVLFDNRGAGDRSRVVAFDPRQNRLVWEYPTDGSGELFSEEAGSCQILSNGNTLITESEMGRALEITPDRQVVWEFSSPHRAGRRGELVATLFEVVRIPATDLSFLSTDDD